MKNKTFIIKTLNEDGSKAETLVIEGDLGIKNAEAIKSAIKSINIKMNSVKIYLKNVGKLDITTIQTIRAFSNDLGNKGKTVSLIAELPSEIERLLTNTGFDKII
jgi:hypothetical protein